MKYLIGLDAGGTKTECVLCDYQFHVLRSIKGEGFNLTAHGIEKSASVVNELIPLLIKDFTTPDKIELISIGAAGAGREGLKNQFTALLQNLLAQYTAAQIKVYSDAESAFAASFPDGKGFILISGTGSILFGKDENQKNFRAGGFGKLLDKGNGYSVGLKAFTHTAKVLDKFKDNDSLTETICNKFNVINKEDLIRLINNSAFNIADAAIYVIQCAEKGSSKALEIIEEETDELIDLIKTVCRQVGKKEINLSFHGSLIANKNIFSEILKQKIVQHFPEINLVTSKYSPAVGSIILALKENH